MEALELMKWRKDRGLTRRTLAISLGVTETSLYRWESENRKVPVLLEPALHWIETQKGWVAKAGTSKAVKLPHRKT